MSERLNKFLSNEYAAGRKFPGFKPVQPNIGNAYTGLKPTKGLTTTVAALAIGYSAVKTGWDMKADRSSQVMQRATDVGNLEAMNYDAVGNVNKGRRDLGATGDIVFGLHNSRRGGY